jgi:hypothetical protein
MRCKQTVVSHPIPPSHFHGRNTRLISNAKVALASYSSFDHFKVHQAPENIGCSSPRLGRYPRKGPWRARQSLERPTSIRLEEPCMLHIRGICRYLSMPAWKGAYFLLFCSQCSHQRDQDQIPFVPPWCSAPLAG